MRRVALTALIAVSVFATACGGGESDVSSRPSDIVAVTTTNPPPFDETDVQFAQEFWHSGFHVALNRAEVWTSTTLLTNRTSYWLTLWGNFENQGNEVAAFDPEMAIVESGTAYMNRSEDPPPRLRPESSALGKLTFLIPEDLDLGSAQLIVGAETENQARIPLGSNGAATRLEPADVAISGREAMELIDLEVTGGSLRYDVPAAHEQLELGKMALTVYFDVTSRVAGDHRVAADAMVLARPDGSTIAPLLAQLGKVPGDPEGITTARLLATFEVDEAATGDFILRVPLGDAFVVEGEVAEAVFSFSL